MSTTLYDKIWDEHLVYQQQDVTSLIYVDRHLVHEVTSPQAFEGLRLNKRQVRKPKLTLAVADHNVPTTDRSKGIDDKESKIQVDTLRNNCKQFGVPLFGTLIDSIKVIRSGKVRRAKLYYLRDRTGKSARIAEKIRKKIGIDIEATPETVTSLEVTPKGSSPLTLILKFLAFF